MTDEIKAIIAPSILACDMSRLAEECSGILNKGADWIHIDVMDGHFVNNITLGHPIVKCLRENLPNTFLDVHMMVENPEIWVEAMAAAGASQYTFHIECFKTQKEAIDMCERIRKLNMKVGISVKPKTDIDCLNDMLQLNFVDTVLIMTVEPGFGGQAFMHSMMPKVKTIRCHYPFINIQVDGGLNIETAKVAAENGANVIVAGTSIFKSINQRKYMEEMRKNVQKFFSGQNKNQNPSEDILP